jgi:transketolase
MYNCVAGGTNGPGRSESDREHADLEASADSKAEAVTLSKGNQTVSTLLSVDEMVGMARKLRRNIVTMIGKAGSGHPGGSLSAVEIVTALYFGCLRHDPANPGWEDRDRFVLSKGHAAPLLYAALAESGYFPLEELNTLRTLGSCLQGHCDMTSTPGVEVSTGSLGQGLSIGVGIGLAGRLDGRACRVYVLLGDGECDEGQVWEAAMAAAHFGLDNLVAIVDHNRQQIDGWNHEVMNIEPLPDKWVAFGWHAIEVDGHDLAELLAAFDETKRVAGRPTVIIAHTIKGKGVSFMENNLDFHGKAPTPAQVERALEELK